MISTKMCQCRFVCNRCTSTDTALQKTDPWGLMNFSLMGKEVNYVATRESLKSSLAVILAQKCLWRTRVPVLGCICLHVYGFMNYAIVSPFTGPTHSTRFFFFCKHLKLNYALTSLCTLLPAYNANKLTGACTYAHTHKRFLMLELTYTHGSE